MLLETTNEQRSETDGTRRRFLHLAGTASVVGLAGCAIGGDSDGSDRETTTTASAEGGTERSAGGLASNRAAGYRPTPDGDQHCSNCRYYRPDDDDDGFGACDLVAGPVEPTGWCQYYYFYYFYYYGD